MERPAFSYHRESRELTRILLPALLVAAGAARADLPEVEDPTRGGDGIIERIQNYGFDIVTLVALLIISVMFLGVCYHAYTTYSEIHTGRKTWGEFGVTVAVGAILLVIAVWLLTTATEIL